MTFGSVADAPGSRANRPRRHRLARRRRVASRPGTERTAAQWRQRLLASTMVLPVALARRWPVRSRRGGRHRRGPQRSAHPDLVRCAAAASAACYIAFAVGARGRENGRGWLWTVVGLVITVGGLLAQWHWDPALNVDSSFLTFGPPLAAWSAGPPGSALVGCCPPIRAIDGPPPRD